VAVLLLVAVPSVSLIYGLEEITRTVAMVVRVVGRQWYWAYQYPTFGADPAATAAAEVEATLRDPLDRTFNRLGSRLLDSVPLLLPVATELELLTTAEDVIHSFTVPSAGVKLDAVPGRLNQLLVNFMRSGIYYGQCSELCGSGHGFMPITAYICDQAWFSLLMLEQTGLLGHYLHPFVHLAYDPIKYPMPGSMHFSTTVNRPTDGGGGPSFSKDEQDTYALTFDRVSFDLLLAIEMKKHFLVDHILANPGRAAAELFARMPYS